MQGWFAEIKLRAKMRIGELVRELEKAKRKGPRGHFIVASGGKSKGEAIKKAGLADRTAHRYQELAGPPIESAQQAATKNWLASLAVIGLRSRHERASLWITTGI